MFINELTLVKSERFGEIEADIYSNGSDMFMTTNQLCDCLNENRSTFDNRISRNDYLKDEKFSVSLKMRGTDGKMYSTRVFNEDGIYEITMLSESERAKEFRTWFRGILKAVRRGQLKPAKDTEAAKLRADALKMNAATRRAQFMLEQMIGAGIDPKHRLIALAEVYNSDGFPVTLPPMEVDYKSYDLTEMAKELGVYSKSGNPHSQAIGYIVRSVNPTADETIRAPYERQGHAGESERYKESVLERARRWLTEHDFPNPIAGSDKKYTVVYKEEK